jgi:ABC-type uncharacterized transport system substrate-binding protein
VTGTHKSYKDAAADLQIILTEKGWQCLVVELPESLEQASHLETETAPSDQSTTAAATTAPAPDTQTAGLAAHVLKALTEANPPVIVTCGPSATTLILENIPHAQVVFCMIPNALDMPFMALDSPYSKRVSGVAMDVLPADQVSWIARVSPNARHICVLHSERSKRTAEALQATGKDKDIRFSLIEAQKDEFPKAVEALSTQGCDGVLMLPDAAVYNSANVQRLLLWGIRQKRPVWAFSANIVKAGAFAGQYPDNPLVLRQTVEIAMKVVDKTPPKPVGLVYLREFQTAINERTAEMIGLEFSPDILESVNTRFGKAP